MSVRTGCFLIAAVFFLLVWGTTWSGTRAARAAVIKVSPANAQSSIDGLPEGTPESSRPKSLQAIMEDADTYVGDEDALEFAPGTYDDIGELIVARPLTLRKDPSMDGDAVITGELLIQIRSRDVRIEGLTFRDLEIGKVTVLADGESSAREHPSAAALTGPIELYFRDVTIPGFLLARKALSAPADRPDKDHDYSGYTGQLTRSALEEHIDGVYSHFFENRNPSSGYLVYNPNTVVSNEDGFPVDNSGGATRWDSGNGKWDVYFVSQEWLASRLGHILINPRYYGSADSCPDSENLTGIEIVRNTFEKTQEVAVMSLRAEPESRWHGRAFPGGDNCSVEARMTGNTFRNIGTGRDSSFIRDSEGNFITDGDGHRIPRNYLELNKYAIGFHSVRKGEILDNTIEGTTHVPVWVAGTPEGGRITIGNNLIRSASGTFPAVASQFAESQIQVRGNADDVKIMITGNRLLGSDEGYPYFYTEFGQFRRRAGWCRSPAVPRDASVEQLETLLQPRIWRSYVPNFPYPGGDGAARPMPPDAPPVKLGDVVASYSGNTPTFYPNVVVGSYDVVRHRSCHPTSRIEIRNQKGVSVTNNDLGYGEEGYVGYGIILWGAGTALAEFDGNNFDYVEEGVIGSFAGNAARVSSKGNYLGLSPYGTSNLDREGELGEPIVRGEGDVGPRSGMTVDNPPAVPRIESAAVSSSDRKTIVLTYNVDIDEESRPTKDAFTVRYRVAQGVTGMITVDNVEVDGRVVTLTLEDEIPNGASGLTVVYSTEAAGDSAVRSPLGETALDGEVAVSDSPATTGEEGMVPAVPGGGTASAGGDGGCALASGGSGGIGFGAVLLFTLAALAFGRKLIGS